MEHRLEYDLKLIGHNLKRLREAKNLTVDEVRRYLRLGSVQAIYKYEAGKSYPPADAMFALMQLYEADLYDIICECEKRPDITQTNVAEEKQLKKMKKYLGFYMKYIDKKAG